MAGDFNIDLDRTDHVSVAINSFLAGHSLVRCDDNMFSAAEVSAYVNEALNRSSTIDYIVTSSPQLLLDYYVTEPGSNFSDHLPIFGSFCCNPVPSHVSGQKPNVYNSQNDMNILSFR